MATSHKSTFQAPVTLIKNQEVGGWGQTKGKIPAKDNQANHEGKSSRKQLEMPMRPQISRWPTVDLPVTMITYNLIYNKLHKVHNFDLEKFVPHATMNLTDIWLKITMKKENTSS